MATLIYHEKQAAALCGRHALNNLLQGRYVDEIMLADIAHELDEEERQLMLSNGTDTPEALNFIAQESGNVDESGNFSISVLREALRRVSGYDLSSLGEDVEGSLRDPETNEAYVLNLHEHWFTLRRIQCAPNNQFLWFNLNSLLKIPEIISPFFLSAFLAQMRQEGYAIFVVKPLDLSIPDQHLPPPVFAIANDSPNSWHTVLSIQNNAKTTGNGNTAFQARKIAADKARQQAENDPEFRHALEASLSEAGLSPYGSTSNKRNVQEMMNEDDQLRLALEASLNDMANTNNNHHPSPYTRAVKPTPNPTTITSSSSSLSSSSSSSSNQQGGIRTLASLNTSDNQKDEEETERNNHQSSKNGIGSTTTSKPNHAPTVHSWGQGNTVGGHSLVSSSSSSSSSTAVPRSPVHNDDTDMDPELRAALQLSMLDQQQILLPSESPLEAVARLQALLPPEPDTSTNHTEGKTVCRIQIRLPPTIAPHDDILQRFPTVQGSTSRQRKFYSTDSLLSVFYFAELCWLEAWLGKEGEGVTKNNVGKEEGITTNVPLSSPSLTSESSTGSVSRSPYPFRSYGLSLSLPSKLFSRKDYSSTTNHGDIPTLEGAGLVPSAALNLRPI